MSLYALIAGILADVRGRRSLALSLLFFAIAATLLFSYLGGFSIGRFTAVIPVLATGYVVGMGRGPVALAAGVVCAALLYAVFTWLLNPLVLQGGVFALVLGAWAIPLYAVLALASIGWALAKPPRNHMSAAQEQATAASRD